MPKLNCWEFLECGREAGGKNVKELGVCPVALEKSADGIHGGVNGGRCCWVIAGTFCGGKVQGIYAKKFLNCLNCKFFEEVSKEEDRFLEAAEIKKRIKK